MNFKQIKYIPNFTKYEMSEDGLIVQDIATKTPVTISPDTFKCELVGDDGTKKLHGARTLYWNSWNKAPTMYPESAKAHTQKMGGKPEVLKKKDKPTLVASYKQLVSGHTLIEIQSLQRRRSYINSNCMGQEVWDGKHTQVRILLDHEDDKMLLKIDCQNWRAGLWFFKPSNGQFIKYVKEEHQPVSGNANIKWPDFPAVVKK